MSYLSEKIFKEEKPKYLLFFVYYLLLLIIVLYLIIRKTLSLYIEADRPLINAIEIAKKKIEEAEKKVIVNRNLVKEKICYNYIPFLLVYCLPLVFMPIILLALLSSHLKKQQFGEKDLDFLELIFELNEVYRKTDDYLKKYK